MAELLRADLFVPGFIALAATLLATWAAYWFGLRAYFLQREHELVRSRYLEGTIDLLSQQVEEALAIFQHNWALALHDLKLVRDLGDQLDHTWDSPSFTHLRPELFQVAPQIRLGALIGDRVFWEATQSLFAFVTTQNAYFERDLGAGLRLVREKKITGAALWERMAGHTAHLQDESHRFYEVLHCLQTLAAFIESSRLRFGDVGGLQHRQEVRDVVRRLRKTFPVQASNGPLQPPPAPGGRIGL
jgi:hypothetical protein